VGFLGEEASLIGLAYDHDAEHTPKNGFTIQFIQDYVGM